MPRLICFVFALFATSLQTVLAQSNSICNLSPEIQEIMKQRMLSNRALFQKTLQTRTGASIYIPVRFFLTAKSDGTGRYQDYYNLFKFFCRTNDCIGDHSMIFYIKEIDESINNTLIHEHPNNEGKKLLDDLVKSKQDAINIFIGDDVNKSSLGIYNFIHDYITFNYLGIIEDSRALCHNLGHFLSLGHTCGLWLEYNCLKKTIDQSPFGKPVEYVSRTKKDSIGNLICSYAGDGFCDTPADYSEFNNASINPCVYQGCAKDPDGVNLDPNIKNPMAISSYIAICFDTFTNQQKQAMLFDYLSPERDYIKVNYIPLGETKSPKYLKPNNQSKLTNYDSIFFDWTDDPNSTDYILEIALNSSFNLKLQQFKTKVSQYLVTSLSPQSRYYWRVLAYNANSFCDIDPIVSIFTTGFLATPTDETQDRKIKYQLHDNKSDHKMVIEFFFNELETAQFKLFDLNGKLIQSQKIQNNRIELDKDQLMAGLYFFNVSSRNKNDLCEKLLIQ